MNSNRNLRLVKFAVLALLIAAFAPQALRADDECSNRTLKGTYMATATGTVVGVGPLANINLVTLDGSGNGQSFGQTRSVNGIIATGGPAPVTYTVNSDCTGTATFAGPAHFNIVVDKKGAGWFFIRTDAGFVASGYTIRLGKDSDQGCSTSTLKGSYRFLATGTRVGVGPIATLAETFFDGSGNRQGTSTTSVNGNISTGTSTGTYTVNSDCTGTQTLVSSGQDVHLNMIIDSNGAYVFFIRTDPGFVLSGQLIRLGKKKSGDDDDDEGEER
jgi:hypothetical protein